MANTTFGNLKIAALRAWGNNYNANDSVKLQIAGNCINRALAIIQGEIKGHPFTLDINNTVAATITTPYKTDLVDTDIIEIFQVEQRSDPRKMKWIPYSLYMEYMADPSRFAGIPSLLWTAVQSVNGSGVNIWSLFFIPTPSSAITIYYDYVKNLQFSSDGSSADAAYSPLPSVYDAWIFDEAKPMFYEVIDPMNDNLITRAYSMAKDSRERFKKMILSTADGYQQAQSSRMRGPLMVKPVDTTPVP